MKLSGTKYSVKVKVENACKKCRFRREKKIKQSNKSTNLILIYLIDLDKSERIMFQAKIYSIEVILYV